MQTTRQSPENYQLARKIDLQTDQTLLVKLNLWGLVTLIPTGYVFLRIGMEFHPEIHTLYQILTPSLSPIIQIAILLVALAAVILAHELIHGVFFWIITRQRPFFGFKGAYAFAAAPDWYIPRNTYFLIGAAPLAIITIIGISILPLISINFIIAWLFSLLANTSGSVGDIYVLATLLRYPATAMIQDRGDVISIYTESIN